MPVCSDHVRGTSVVLIDLFLGSRLHSHRVELTLALLGDHAASFFVLLNKAHFLKLLQNVAGDLAGGLRVGVCASTSALLRSIHLTKGTHTHALADVDLPHPM